MRPDDFIVESDVLGMSIRELNENLVDQVRAGVSGHTDIEVAVPLARLLHEEFEKYGTDRSQILSSDQARSAMSALRAVLRRLAVEFTPPFLDLDTFFSYWRRNGASGPGGWQARRDILSSLFDPLHEKLADIEAAALSSELAVPIGDRSRTGWTRVDEEVAELRRHFQLAQSSQDYRNVGNDCVTVIERLSEAAFDPSRHLKPEEAEPPVSNTKARLDLIVDVELAGSSNRELRKLARAAIEQAQAVKHRNPDRLQAGIAADSVILLVSIFRRLLDPEH